MASHDRDETDLSLEPDNNPTLSESQVFALGLIQGSTLIHGNSSQIAASRIIRGAKSSILSTAHLTISGTNYVKGRGTLGVRVSTVANSTNTTVGAAALGVRTNVVAVAKDYSLSTASLQAKSTIAASGLNRVQGTASLKSRTLFVPSAGVKHAGIAAFHAVSTSLINALSAHAATMNLGVFTVVAANAQVTHNAVVITSSSGELAATAVVTHKASASLVNRVALSGNTSEFKYGSVSATTKSFLTAVATNNVLALVGAHGVTTITAVGSRTYSASTQLNSRVVMTGASTHTALAVSPIQSCVVLIATAIKKAGTSLALRNAASFSSVALVTHNAKASIVVNALIGAGTLGAARLANKNTFAAKGSLNFGARAAVKTSTTISGKPSGTLSAIASLRSTSISTGFPSKRIAAQSELNAITILQSSPLSLVTSSVSIMALSEVSASGTRLVNVATVGGVIVGGSGKVESPVYNYLPINTFIDFVGITPASLMPVYAGTGQFQVTGHATVSLNQRYVAQGSIGFTGQSGIPPLSYTLGYGLYWRLNQAATANIDFYWAVGRQRQYWWRVLGDGRTDICPPVGGDNCCKTFLATIQARTVDEVCEKIKERFGIWPIKSIQRFSKPAENSAIAEDLAAGITYECNELIDTPFCAIPKCASFCVQYPVKEYWGTKDVATQVPAFAFVQILSMTNHAHESSGNISFTNSSPAQLHFDTSQPKKKLKFEGTARIRSSHYRHDGKGSFHIGGTADRAASYWNYQCGNWHHTKPVIFHTEQTKNGAKWIIEDVITNDMADENSSMLMFTNLVMPKVDEKLSGIVVSFDRCAKGQIRDAEVVTMSSDKVLRTLTKPFDWPNAISVKATYGSGTDLLGFVPGKPFSIGIKVRSTVAKQGLLAKITNPKIEAIYDMGGLVKIGGSANVGRSFWKYESSGSVTINGSAYCQLVKKKSKPSVSMLSIHNPDITVQGLSKEKIKSKKELLVHALTTTITHTTITSIGQAVVPTLTPPIDTINECLCSNMPLTLPFAQNFAYNNKLAQFATRNGITIPRYIGLERSTVNDSWQANLSYNGRSVATVSNETWSMVFEFRCTDILGAMPIGKKVWKFAMKIKQRDSLTGDSQETRLVVAFLPEPICSQGKQFRFKLTLDTQLILATIDPASTIYELVMYDGIGLFKTASWTNKPNLIIDMSNSSIPSPIPRYPLYIESNS